jgi:hypothetical protein
MIDQPHPVSRLAQRLDSYYAACLSQPRRTCRTVRNSSCTGPTLNRAKGTLQQTRRVACVDQRRLRLGIAVSSRTNMRAAAAGIAISAPMIPSSVPPIRVAITVSRPGTCTVRAMTFGVRT